MEHIAIKRADFDGILKLISMIRDDLNALQEERGIISDKEFAGRIAEGLADIEEGGVYGFEEFERVPKNKLQKVNKEGKVRIWLRLRE